MVIQNTLTASWSASDCKHDSIDFERMQKTIIYMALVCRVSQQIQI